MAEKQDMTSFEVLKSEAQSSCDESCSQPTAGDREISEEDRTETINNLCATCGPDDGERKPLRVVLIGLHGSGKSSFINSLAAALSETRWSEHAKTGLLKTAEGITCTNRRYVKCGNDGRKRYADVLLPTLIDVAGLTENPDDRIAELLNLLFYGHIEEFDSLMRVYSECKQLDLSIAEIRQKFRTCHQEMRVDRVIFLAAADKDLPVRLMQCVHRATNPAFDMRERREVPLFGVLTHKDKVDLSSQDFLERRDQFMGHLGLILPRLLICSNYCDKLDPDNQRIKRLQPELDVPILEFINEVCEGARMVTSETQVLPGTEMEQDKAKAAVNRYDWNVPFEDLVISVLAGFMTLLLAVYILLPGPDNSVKEDCIRGHIQSRAVCDQFSVASTLTRWLRDVVLAALVSAGVFVVLRSRRD